MSEVWIPLVAITVSFFSLVAIVRNISDNAVRRKAVDKGLSDADVKALFQRQQENNLPSSLKWGMVSVALGLAILVGQMVPNFRQEEATISAMLILGGLSLILFYFIATKLTKKD